MVLAGLLYAGSGAGLAIVQLLRFSFIQRTEPNAWPSRGDWSWLAAAILAGGIVGPILLMFGLATTAASTTSLLLHDLRQRLRKGRWPRYGIADSE